ncbi:MAG TPA: carboxypeptidase-like regulatory domain-containing protein, partial [Gemmatimonadales bacterium]|nr:carboxypeptidase-like regulatory domain-containing protein [Gemmatimonadales bacterium]
MCTELVGRGGQSRRLAMGLVFMLGLAMPLAAQGGTGKVEGIIKDAGGQPVANAQVRILGTAFATTANTAGYYFFNSVPAGSYDIRVNY